VAKRPGKSGRNRVRGRTNMKVLVTGTEGYIGTLLGPLLLARGHEVVGLDTGFYRNGRLYGGVTLAFPQVDKDIRQIEAADLAGFDAVVHLAELSNDPLGQHNPAITYAINHLGSVALAQQCKKAGIPRFVYTSSCSVYGVGGGDEIKTEASPLNPQTAYAECKVLVERDVAALADSHFSPTFLRNATAYGASPRMRFDLVVNNLAGLAWTTHEIKLTSDGTPWRPLVHVLDIGEAIACTLEAPRAKVHNQIFNVGDTQANYQIRTIAEIVADTFPGCRLALGRSDGDNRSYRVSFDKIQTQLPGFQCRWTVAKGVEELRSIFAQIKLSPETFRDRAYTRLKQLEYLLKTEQVDEFLYWRHVLPVVAMNRIPA
jgi:nucleoside-diphosphate-sugar epimerase